MKILLTILLALTVFAVPLATAKAKNSLTDPEWYKQAEWLAQGKKTLSDDLRVAKEKNDYTTDEPRTSYQRNRDDDEDEDNDEDDKGNGGDDSPERLWDSVTLG